MFLRVAKPVRFFAVTKRGREAGSVLLSPGLTYPVTRIKSPVLHNGPDWLTVKDPEYNLGHDVIRDGYIVGVSFAALRGLRSGIINLFGSEDDDRDAADAFDVHIAQEVIARIMACYA
jgi:hypothetical protein